MEAGSKPSGPGTGRGRPAVYWEALRASFGLLSGLAMLGGIVLGLALPALDHALGVSLPVLSFDSQSSARSLLETIATATVSVAGLSFSVTVVAFTLAAQQLTPRVLRSFRRDRLSQVTLALFLGTFIYCLTLLVRLGISGPDSDPPNLSMTLAVLLALVSFVTFAGFIAHIISMLQPSSVISAIHDDAVKAAAERYPAGGGEPDEPEAALAEARRLSGGPPDREILSRSCGYLTAVDTSPIISAAAGAEALVQQCVLVGTYVMPGQKIAEVWGPEDDSLDRAIDSGFGLGEQRTLVQDVAFPVRQLADIALKGLSPGINDPTTAENAMDSLAAFLVKFARTEEPPAVRVDGEGRPRLITAAPGLDTMVGLGFEQVRAAAEPHAVTSLRLVELLELLDSAAQREGIESSEIKRQLRLTRPNADFG